MPVVIDDNTSPSEIEALLHGHATGLIPRDFTACPQGYMAVAEPFNIPLIDEAEMEERIAEEEAKQSSLEHIRDIADNGSPIKSYSQNGQGYCWAYSTTAAVTLARAVNNQPFKRLSAHMVGCLVKNYRNQGGWCTLSLDFIAKHGVASEKFWKPASMRRQNDTPEMREDARKHRALEWFDLSDDPDVGAHQLATCLLLKIPTATDRNHWSHSTCDVRLISWKPFTVRTWNSHGESSGNRGMIDLVGRKAVPNGAVAVRTVVASTV